MKIESFTAVTAALLLALSTGCAGDDDNGGATGSATAASAGDTGGTGDDDMTSSDPGVTTGATAGDDPPEPQPNGADCLSNDECISGMCFSVPVLGGICGDCLTDDDCPDGGCNLPIPDLFPTGPKGAECNDGSLGGGCNSDEACQGDLVCSVLIEASGILTASGCSECDSDADCPGDQLCSPSYDIANLTGQRTCIDAGTVPNGEGCDHEGTGNEACTSGHCYEFSFMGLVSVGVCGECGSSADCEEGESCQEPDIDTDTFEVQPPVCQ